MKQPTQVFRIALTLLALTVGCLTAQPTSAAVRASGPDFGGVWSSAGCEPYPGGPFARREIVIEAGRFSQVITAFADGGCSMPKLRMRVEGRFVFRGISPIIPSPGVYDVELRWEQVFIRAEHTNQAEFLNTHRPGLCAGNWSVGVEQDLAGTNGCRKLGIDLRRPIVEYDITGRVGDVIYLGARPSDGGLLTSAVRRPISFGAPLNKTNEVLEPSFAPAPVVSASPLLPATGAKKARP